MHQHTSAMLRHKQNSDKNKKQQTFVNLPTEPTCTQQTIIYTKRKGLCQIDLQLSHNIVNIISLLRSKQIKEIQVKTTKMGLALINNSHLDLGPRKPCKEHFNRSLQLAEQAARSPLRHFTQRGERLIMSYNQSPHTEHASQHGMCHKSHGTNKFPQLWQNNRRWKD